MKTLIPTFAFALISSTAFGQELYATSTFASDDNDPAKQTFIQRFQTAAVGSLSYSDSQTLTFGASTFQGQTRSTVDYGRIGLYARADLEYGNDAPFDTRASAGGSFLDPLTISGGSAGDTIHAEIRLRGTPKVGFPYYLSYGYYTNVEFYYFQDGQYVSAGNQTFERHDDGVPNESIDLTVAVTLTDYDPTRTYYLNGVADVAADVGKYNIPSLPSTSTFVDAEHTAEITKIGFVGANGLSGRFVGGSGTLYPVPEPASFLALGAGLAFLRRAKRKG